MKLYSQYTARAWKYLQEVCEKNGFEFLKITFQYLCRNWILETGVEFNSFFFFFVTVLENENNSLHTRLIVVETKWSRNILFNGDGTRGDVSKMQSQKVHLLIVWLKLIIPYRFFYLVAPVIVL